MDTVLDFFCFVVEIIIIVWYHQTLAVDNASVSYCQRLLLSRVVKLSVTKLSDAKYNVRCFVFYKKRNRQWKTIKKLFVFASKFTLCLFQNVYNKSRLSERCVLLLIRLYFWKGECIVGFRTSIFIKLFTFSDTVTVLINAAGDSENSVNNVIIKSLSKIANSYPNEVIEIFCEFYQTTAKVQPTQLGNIVK